MATERPATQAKRILVVEDEPMIRMLLEDMLGELGYTIAAEAARIEEAVVSLTRPRFCAADRGTDNHRSRSMTCARDNPGCRGTNSVSCRDIEIHRRWLFALGAQSVAAHSC